MPQPEDFNEDDVAFEGKSNLPTAEEGYPSGTPIEALEGAEPVDLESDAATEAIVEEGLEVRTNALGTTDQETVDSVAFDNTADAEDVAVSPLVEPKPSKKTTEKDQIENPPNLNQHLPI